MPRVAKILPIRRHFAATGAECYGFHGSSYAFLTEELTRDAGTEAAQGRVILCHLGRLDTPVFAGGIGENAPRPSASHPYR